MSVVVRLQRGGRTKSPFYTIVAADSRRARDGRYLERLGHYNPMARGADVPFTVNKEALDAWVAKGAQLSDTVTRLLVKFEVADAKLSSAYKARKDRRIKAEQFAKDFAAKKEAAKAAKEGAAAEAEAAPAEEAPAAEAAPAETPAAEAAAEAPAEAAAAAEEAPAETPAEAPAEEAPAAAEEEPKA